MKRFLKNKYAFFLFFFPLLNYFLSISEYSKGWISTRKIDENDMQNYFGNIEKIFESKLTTLEKNMHNYFGNIEKMLESKLSSLEKRFIPDQGFPKLMKMICRIILRTLKKCSKLNFLV